MSYLLTKILIWLLVVGLLGLVFGWLFRGAKFRALLQNKESEWDEKLELQEQKVRSLNTALDGSVNELDEATKRYASLQDDHKSLSREFEDSVALCERFRISLKKEREALELTRKQLGKMTTEIGEAESSIATLTSTTKADRTTITDLNTYLEAANKQKKELRNEVYSLGKALNEASISSDKQVKKIENLELSFDEQVIQIDQFKENAEKEASDHSILSVNLNDLQHRLEKHQSESIAQRQEADRKEAELRLENTNLQEALAEHEAESKNSVKSYEDQLDLTSRERDEATQRLDSLQFQFAEINKERESQSQQALSLTQDLQRQLDVVTGEYSAANEKVQRFSEELEEEKRARNTQQSSASGLEKEAEQLKLMLVEKEGIRKQEKMSLDKLIRDLEQDKSVLEKTIETTSVQLQSEITGRGELELQIKEIQKQYDDREHVLDQTRQRLIAAESSESKFSIQREKLVTEQNQQLLVLKQQFQNQADRSEKVLADRAKEIIELRRQLENFGEKIHESAGSRPVSLTAPRKGVADDLKRISGVGPKIEQTLNKLGVFHFYQIANFTQENTDWVNEHLSFKGRIEREEWITQAKVLESGEDTEFSQKYQSSEDAVK